LPVFSVLLQFNQFGLFFGSLLPIIPLSFYETLRNWPDSFWALLFSGGLMGFASTLWLN